jgi:hypothetical protein
MDHPIVIGKNQPGIVGLANPTTGPTIRRVLDRVYPVLLQFFNESINFNEDCVHAVTPAKLG